MPLIGSHMSVSGGLHKSVARAEALGLEAMQIFTRNPLQWGSKALTDAEIDPFRRAVLASSLKAVVSHASYLINLAGDGRTRARSEQALADEIARCDALGIDSIVLHPGSAAGSARELAVERLVESLGTVLRQSDTSNVSILLETMSGQGDALGASVEELADVIEMLGWDDRLGVCADTCHMFAAGTDIRSEGGYERAVSTLKRQVGLSRVRCWHASDCKSGLGMHIDRHEHIGEGEIGTTPFSLLAADARFEATPLILETPKGGIGDEGNLALLRKLRGHE